MMKHIQTFVLLVIFQFTFLSIARSQENADNFKPNGKLVSQIFGDYYFVAMADTGINSIDNAVLKKKHEFNAFTFRRANLGYEYNFTKSISSMIRIEANENSLTADGNEAVWLRDAYIKFSGLKNHEIIVGSQPTAAVDVSEPVWGNRFLEKMMVDIRCVVARYDFGISVRGKTNDAGKIYYSLMVANNSPYKPEPDKYKRVYLTAGCKPTDSTDVMIYGDYSRKKTEFHGDKGYNKDEMVFGFFAGLKKKMYSGGLDAFYKIANNCDYRTDTINLESTGVSVFASYKFNPQMGIVARYDFIDYNVRQSSVWNYRQYALIGFTWSPVKEITVSPNIVAEFYEKNQNRKLDPSVWPRLTLNWIIK
jgi:hypothetical protein